MSHIIENNKYSKPLY